jgi:hypothetical protein
MLFYEMLTCNLEVLGRLEVLSGGRIQMFGVMPNIFRV